MRGFACHHLNSVDVYPDQQHNPQNGVYLIKKVHSQFHRNYGFGKTNEQQFAQFCQKFYQFDWYERKKFFNLLTIDMTLTIEFY